MTSLTAPLAFSGGLNEIYKDKTLGYNPETTQRVLDQREKRKIGCGEPGSASFTALFVPYSLPE